MTHKFKPGDKVRIVRKGNDQEMKGRGWTSSMDRFIGTTQTVRSTTTTTQNDTPGYIIEDGGWDFPECVLEPVVKEVPSKEPGRKKFKKGDKVRCVHLDDIPGESDCCGGRKPYSYLKKGGIYTIQNVDLECKVDNANFYISLVEDSTVLHPGRFELVEEEKYDIGVDTSLPIGLSSALGEQTKELAELRKRAMDKVRQDEMVRRMAFAEGYLASSSFNTDKLEFKNLYPIISDEDLLLLL